MAKLTAAQNEVLAQISETGYPKARKGSALTNVMASLRRQGLIRFELVGQLWVGDVTQNFGKWVLTSSETRRS